MSRLTKEQQKRIEDYLEGRLQGEDRLRLEKWLVENPAGQAYRLFLEKLGPLSASASGKKAPAELVNQIMSQIERPNTVTVSPLPWPKAGFALAGLLLAAFIGFQWFHSSNQAGPKTTKANISFILNAPGSREVELVGDFTAWKKIPLKREGEQWKLQIPVSAIQDSQYVFILNGRLMVIDPDNSRVIREKNGDFYSVLHPGTQAEETISMRRADLFKTTGTLLAAIWLGAFSPAAVEAEGLSQLSLKIKSEAQSAGLTQAQTQSLVERANQLEAKGLPEKSIEDVAEQILVLGKGPALEKAFSRLGLLVSEGLAPGDAGKVVVKEAQEDARAADEEMEKSLEAGLKESPSKSPSSPVKVLTRVEIEEKLEQKQQEWEERMEKEKEIQFIQHDNLERSR